jgi:hypothetical protein
MGAYALVQTGQKLYQVKSDGTQLEIGLPAGVTVSSYRPVRGRVLNRTLVLTNGVSKNIQLDANLVPRILTPESPSVEPSSAVGAAGNLTGNYRWKYSFAVMDGTRVKAESGLSPASESLPLTADQASLTAIAVSADSNVNARRIYRTTDGGSLFFLVTTLSNNTATTYTDNTTDEATALFPADDSLGTPAGATDADRITFLETWRDRLWGVFSNNPDRVYFSGNRTPWGWNEDYYFTAGAEGADLVGVTALAARKNELIAGKRRSLYKITGEGIDQFGLDTIPGTVGFWAPESVVVINDAVYFVAEFDVYKWDGRLTNLTRERLHTWFAEALASRGGVFNLALLEQAFGHHDEFHNTYDVYLPSTDSLSFDRWLTLDLSSGEWLGPHRTEAFTPTCAGVLEDANGRQRPAVGASNGGIYFKNSNTFSDAGSAIDFEMTVNPHHQGEPDLEKFWGELTVHSEPTTGTLTVKAKVGALDAPQGVVAVVSITRIGSTATVQTNGEHHFGTGQAVTIAGGTGLSVDYNGIWEIVRTSSTAFTFDLGLLTPETPANGTITALLPIRGDLTTSMALDRNRLGRLGVGRFCQLTFENAEDNTSCTVRGYEIEPVTILGRR